MLQLTAVDRPQWRNIMSSFARARLLPDKSLPAGSSVSVNLTEGGTAPSATVAVEAGRGRAQRVVVGHIAPDGVEILSDLNTGDRIVWTPTPVRQPQS